MGSLESSNESSRTLNTPLPTQIKLNPSNNVFIFKEPSPLPENFGMPLIILPNSNSQAPWRHIASDILRSIHSEYSFAKKTDFSFKKKPNLSQNTPILTDISSPKTINETDKTKAQIPLALYPLNNPHYFEKSNKMKKLKSKALNQKTSSRYTIILKTKAKENKWDNISWEKFHYDIVTDFDNFDEESQENIIDNIRRKSCEGDSYGHLTNFQKKANLLSFDNFQTRYLQKKIEMQRYLLEMDKERTKSTIISRQAKRAKYTFKKENPTLILLKNHAKSSSIQIKNSINSSLKTNSLRRSIAVSLSDEKTFENFEISNSPKKKTIIFEDDFGPPFLEKRGTNEEEFGQNSTDRNEKDIVDFHDKTDVKIEEYPSEYDIVPPRRVTYSIPSKKFEEKPTIQFLRRAKTFAKEKEISETPQNPNPGELAQKNLRKKIELIYNQFSPAKVQAKSFLNSPSELSRGNNSIRKKCFTNENEKINEQKEEQILNLHQLKTKEKTVTLNPDDFRKMLKLNTPKYVLFKENTLDKMIPKKKNLIYLNNKLMRILNKQKKGFSTTSMIKPTKNLDNVDNNKQYTKISFQSTISQNDLTLKKFSKFKIRKVLNNNISNVNLEQDERQQKLLKHRKNKSNIQP